MSQTIIICLIGHKDYQDPQQKRGGKPTKAVVKNHPAKQYITSKTEKCNMRNTGKQNTSDAITGRRFECNLESQ